MSVSHLEVLVEEQSMEAAPRILLPRLLDARVTFQVYPSNGKRDLLTNLSARLRGYQSWLPNDWRIVVLVDRDDDVCAELKEQLETVAQKAGLQSKSSSGSVGWRIVNRLAIEELEAWFTGDMDAIRNAYPRVPSTIERQAQYRDPDAIRGGTWETLERVLRRAGYFSTGLRKVEAARTIAAHMDPDRNRSRSFQLFRDVIQSVKSG